MFTVYILFSEKHNQIYVGYTTDLIQRFHSHNAFAKKGHTIKYRPWKVISGLNSNILRKELSEAQIIYKKASIKEIKQLAYLNPKP